jgi:hypothetical protein
VEKSSQVHRKVLNWMFTGPDQWRPSVTIHGRNASSPCANTVEFRIDEQGTYSGLSDGDRLWRISPIVTGWRLEFRDPGDQVATYAGSHQTLKAARIEAARTVSLSSRQAQHRRAGIGSLSPSEQLVPQRAAWDEAAMSADVACAARGDAEDRTSASQTTRPRVSGGRRVKDRRRGEDRRQTNDDSRCGEDRRLGGDRRRGNADIRRGGERRRRGEDRRHRDDRRAPDSGRQ